MTSTTVTWTLPHQHMLPLPHHSLAHILSSTGNHVCINGAVQTSAKYCTYHHPPAMQVV